MGLDGASGAAAKNRSETQARIGGPRGRAASRGVGIRKMVSGEPIATVIGPARGVGSVGSSLCSTAAVVIAAQYGHSRQSMP